MDDAARDILGLVQAQGFALGGIAPALPSDHAEAVRRWVADGRHGTMAWLAAHLDVRLDPRKLVEGARSVIAVADAYVGEGPRGQGPEGSRGKQEEEKDEGNNSGCSPSDHSAPRPRDPSAPYPRGRIARYAWGDDYHKVMKKRLHALADVLRERYPGHVFRATVDTAPALEREHAARAGMGWQAKNTMMIHPRHGSYTLLGLIVTTLEIEGPRGQETQGPRGQGAEGSREEQNKAAHASPHSSPGALGPSAPSTDHCANCTRCIDACPTQAIAPNGYAIDASRCVSYLTIEHRGVIDDALLPGVGDWLAGCDICQAVCPYNAIGARNPLPVPAAYDAAPRKFDEGLDALEVLRWTAEDRQRVFRGSALKRIKLDMIRRNALIVLGNALAAEPDAALRAVVRGRLEDESELVRATAAQVLRRLDSQA